MAPRPGPAPVVMLHGARTSRTMWRPQLAALQRLGREAVAVDLPGHGERRGETFSVESSLAAVDDVTARLGRPVVLLGSSLGAYLSIAWAARRPSAVTGLVLSGCCVEPDRRLTDAWLLAARLIARLPDRGDRLNATVVRLTMPAQGAADLAAGGFALDVMADLLRAMRAVRPLEDLPRIDRPVWFVNGQWDHFRLQERAFLAATRQPRRVVVRGANHLAGVSRPVAFNRALLAALADLDAVAGSGHGDGVTGRRPGRDDAAPGPDGGPDHHQVPAAPRATAPHA